MSRAGRATLWITGALLLLLVLAVALMLEAVEGHLGAGCMDAVAREPDGAFVRSLDAAADGRVRVLYDDGLTVSLPAEPQRIVSTLPGLTEMIAYLGAGDRLVAVSPWCDTPALVAGLRKVTVQPFDAEGILAARPDLVIVDRRLHRRDVAVIQRRCPAVLLLESSRSVPHLVASMEVLAAVLGGEQARLRAVAFADRAQALVARVAAGRPATPPRVLVLVAWDPLYALGPGALLDDLLRICGAVNVACDLGTDASGTFSEELVLARRPGWILTPEAPMPERLRTRWRHVPAVRDGRLAPAWADDLVRGGPRILSALERLAAVLRGARPPAELEVPR